MSVPPRITDPRARPTGLVATLRAYVALTKPRIIELLLVTTVPAMVLAGVGWPGTWLVVNTLVGGTLSAAGAHAINNYLDRDIDVSMRRTAHRPIPAEKVEPVSALRFGILLGLAGFAWLAITTNLLAAALATAALLFYVFVYTIALKRSTPQNIVIGGAAGAVPALVGWAAVRGEIELGGWVLFAIVFLWTPPHFWALSLRFREDYARAGVPMLPVVAGEARTIVGIVRYTLAVVGVSLLLPLVSEAGWFYTSVAAAIGAAFVAMSLRLRRRPEEAMRLFTFSNVYLTVLFAAVAVDAIAFAS